MAIEDLQPAARNPKKHASQQVQKSIGRFGFTEPIVLDERTMRLVAGHGRREALLEMQKAGQEAPEGVRVEDGKWMAPVLRGWSSRSDTEAEAYLLASNRLTELGGWEETSLAQILAELEEMDALDGVGFDNDYITKLLDEAAPKVGATDPDDVPEVPEGKAVYVRAGDIYILGEHRIICGSSTERADVDRVMGGELASICWTDPPWNVAYGEANGSDKHTAIANDDLGDAFPGFCAAFCGEISRVLRQGAPVYMAMSAQEWPTIHGALVSMGMHWSSTIIWVKDSLVLSRKDYHTQYEPIWYGWKEGAARLVELEDRTQSDVWNIDRPKKSDEHPTMKPVELIVRSLKNSSKRGDIVFEPFSGSGSTLMACEQTGRRCRAIELEPKYVQVAIERWEAFTGKKAVRG